MKTRKYEQKVNNPKTPPRVDDLEDSSELKRKAQVFDEIRKIEDEYYEEHGEFITTEDFVYTVDTILNNYERSESADDDY